MMILNPETQIKHLNGLFGITQVRGRLRDILNFQRSPRMVKGMMQRCFKRSDVISRGCNVLQYFSKNFEVTKMDFEEIRT